VDINLLFEAACESVQQASRWLAWCHANYSLEESLEWVIHCQKSWASGQEYNFAVLDSKGEAFLGGVGLNQIDWSNGVANLGYWVRTSRSGQGIATAAARLAVTFGFEELHLNRIEITVAIANAASRRVAEKLGAVHEGVLPKKLLVAGQVHDAVLFSLRSDEWRE
jgi:RimJ/RimL family protein N-acetyltransferase